MPANLTPQYKEAEERYRAARTPAEKLVALEEMLSIIPKHKGTEHLQADIKRKIAKLRDGDGKKDAQSKRGLEYNVEKEGAGQVTLVGPPNSGKSSLLSTLSKAHAEIGEYPFTTHKPQPGMMPYEDIRIQIVDLPPISEEFTEAWVVAIARNSDAVLLVLDAADPDVLSQIETTISLLEKFKLRLCGWEKPCEDDGTGLTSRKTLMVLNKMDMPDAAYNLEIVREFFGESFPVYPVSSETESGLDVLKTDIFKMLDIVRVYTKMPGKPADKESPFVLANGSTLLDLASMIHKDFAQKLKFAKIWSHQKFEGQMVSRDYVLADGDIIELHVQ